MRIAFSILFILLCFHCQSQDSLAMKELDELVITGEVEPQSVRKSLHKVRIIPMERIELQGATRLQDVLATELNVRFSQDLALGGSNVSLQGLSGQNVKVLLDGVPVIGRQGTGNEININQINVNSIERIEIIEGPMSVIYGADALAGVINIITKKPEEELLSGSAKIQLESVGDEFGTDKGIHMISTTLDYKKKSLYTHAELTRNLFNGWKGEAVDRELTWHSKNQWLAGGVLGYKTEKTDVYYRADFLHEKIYNPANFSGTEALDQNYITQRLMQQVQATTVFTKKLNFNTALSFTNFERKTQSISVDQASGKETLAIGPGLQDVTRFTGLTFRGILNIKASSSLSIQTGYDINAESGSGGRLEEGNNEIVDFAVFVLGDVTLTPWLSVKPGLRIIKNSVYQAPPFIPSLNMKATLNEKHDLRLAYGRGFRAPSLRELYFNFFDASHSIEGNADLEAELSHSLNASWNAQWIKQPFYSYATVIGIFYNDLENMISTGVKPGNTNTTTYLNIDHYKTTGATITNTFKRTKLEATLGFAYTGRYNQLEAFDATLPEFTWSPEVNSSISYRFPFNWSTALFYKFTGKLPYYEIRYTTEGTEEIALAESDHYHWMDFTLKKSYKKLNVTIGIRNILDVTSINNTSQSTGGGHTISGARPIGYGRSYFTGIQYLF